MPEGYQIETDEVEWGGVDTAVASAAVISWAGVLWMGYRVWRLLRRGD